MTPITRPNMCERCLAKSIDYGEPIPGILLCKATVDVDIGDEDFEWHAGDYGLAILNGPFFVFSRKPWPDPMTGLSEEEIEALPAGDPKWEKANQWLTEAREFSDNFLISLHEGMVMTKACFQAGYTEEYGDPAMWFFHRMGVFLETATRNDGTVAVERPLHR